MGTKRDVEAFGQDTSKTGGLTARTAGSFGKQTDATPSKSDEPQSGNKRRPVRAFGYLPRAALGKLQQDHSRGDRASRQFFSTGEAASDTGGVNSTGRTLKPVDPYFVDNFQGRSGQPDNQDTFRPKGKT